MKKLFNELSYYTRKAGEAVRDTANGFGFKSFPQGVNTVLTSAFALQTAFAIHAGGPGALVSMPALFTGIGLGYAWHMGRNPYRYH